MLQYSRNYADTTLTMYSVVTASLLFWSYYILVSFSLQN